MHGSSSTKRSTTEVLHIHLQHVTSNLDCVEEHWVQYDTPSSERQTHPLIIFWHHELIALFQLLFYVIHHLLSHSPILELLRLALSVLYQLKGIYKNVLDVDGLSTPAAVLELNSSRYHVQYSLILLMAIWLAKVQLMSWEHFPQSTLLAVHSSTHPVQQGMF